MGWVAEQGPPGELRSFQARLSLKIKEGDKTWVRRL